MSATVTVTIAALLQQTCPNLRLGVLVGSVPANGTGDPALTAALDSAVALWRDTDPAPAESWLTAMAETFRRAGANPSRYAPSAAALVKRLRQGKGIYRINDVVDCNNLVSLELGIPCGIYDREHVSGTRLQFDLGAPQVSYLGIDGVEQRTQGKLLLTDRDKVAGGPHADAYPTRITADTRHLLQVLFYPDALESPRAVHEGLRLAASRLTELLHGIVLTSFVAGGESWGAPMKEQEEE